MLKVTQLTKKQLFYIPGYHNHKAVFFLDDPAVSLQAFVGIHRVIDNLATGGVRISSSYEKGRGGALADVLRLSRAMTSKNVLAGLRIGGGKGVIFSDPQKPEPSGLIDSFGEGINQIAANHGIIFYAAEDSGFSIEKIGRLAKVTPYAVGRLEISGDPSDMTALGIREAIDTCSRLHIPSLSVDQISVFVHGACGHVGRRLCRLLSADGYQLFLSDINPDVNKMAAALKATVIGNMEESLSHAHRHRILSLCSTHGGFITRELAEKIICFAVAGATNNLLADDAAGDALFNRRFYSKGNCVERVMYAVDFAANAGGIINVFAEIDELRGGPKYYRDGVVKLVTETVRRNLEKIFRYSREENIPEFRVARILAEEAFSSFKKGA